MEPQGSQVLEDSIVVDVDPPALKGTSDLAMNGKAHSNLGLQQKSFKKGSLEKPSRSGRKTDQEKVKMMGDTLVESRSVKPIDSHFTHPHK